MKKELNYDEILVERKKIAQIISDNYFLSGLETLNKQQLIEVVLVLTERIDEYKNVFGYDPDEREDYPYDERKMKDIAFDRKSVLIDELGGLLTNE